MTPEEYESYHEEAPIPVVRGFEVDPIPMEGVRILLHGYESDRSNFFVGVRYNRETGAPGEPEIGRAVDASHGLVWVWQEEWYANQLVPHKRIFPERTDYAFVTMVRDRITDPLRVAPMLPYDHEWAGWDPERLPKDANPGKPWAPLRVDYAAGTARAAR
jgi:hypothetical protein